MIPQDRRALIAIDLGAESCRVSLLRWCEGRPHLQLVHRFANAAVERDGAWRWPFEHILQELHASLAHCAKLAPEGIRSIGVDGWAVDYVRLDANGMAIAEPFCYRDQRTVAAETALHERLSASRMRELTGIQIMRINTAYQLFSDGPELRGKPWLNLPEYVLFRLGARPVSEFSNATHTQMVGSDGAWSPEILKAIGCDAGTVPEIVASGTDLGRMRGPLATLPAFANTRLIAPCCHDTASAIAGVPDAAQDWAYISSGTWSLVGTLLSAPVNTAAAASGNFTNLGGAEGRICFHRNVNGMWLLRQCMDYWNAAGAALDVPGIITAAEGIEPKSYVLNVDDPDLLLQGEMPERINRQLRARSLPELSTSGKDAAELASLIFHSLAARYAEVLSQLTTITGKKFRCVYVLGGASQNLLLNRLTAQATGLDVHRGPLESSTIGNLAVQMRTLEATGERTLRESTQMWASMLQNEVSKSGLGGEVRV